MGIKFCGNNKQKVKKTQINGVTLISINDYCDKGFDKTAVSIELTIDTSDGWMANYMCSDYWTKSCWGYDLANIPERTQVILWRKGIVWNCLYAFADNRWMTRFKGAKEKIVAEVSCGLDGEKRCEANICFYAEGNSTIEVMRKIANAASIISPAYVKMREDRRYPNLFEKLGWCSWDALDINVNSEDVIKKAEEFKSKCLPVGWFLLDDMWADVKGMTDLNSRFKASLNSFGPDPIRFPRGLANLSDKLKRKYDINTGVWYTVQGYWSGISEDGDLALCLENDLEVSVTKPHEADVNKILRPKANIDAQTHFHENFCRYLRNEGISFIKVDNQSGEERMWQNIECTPYVARNVHEGIESAAGKYFDMNLINCMGMAVQDLWNRPTSAINRNSDDFLPGNIESFNEHAIANAYNSFVYGEVMWTDWDMWWTGEISSVKSGVLRGISGGPIYLSDKLNKTKAEDVFPLILSNGTILRFDRPGIPASDILLKNPLKENIAFKVVNNIGCFGAVAIYNMNENSKNIKAEVSVSDIPFIENGKYLAYEYFTKSFKIIDSSINCEYMLSPEDVFAVSLCPIIDGFAVIGLKDKYFPCTTIGQWHANKNAMQCVVKDGGEFLFYSEKTPKTVIINGKTSKYSPYNGLYQVNIRKMGNSSITVIL